jgi:hypothetical protein
VTGELGGTRCEAVERDMLAVEQPRGADEQPLSVDGGNGAVAGHGLEGPHRRPANAAKIGGLNDGLRERMLGLAFDGGDKPQQLSPP